MAAELLTAQGFSWPVAAGLMGIGATVAWLNSKKEDTVVRSPQFWDGLGEPLDLNSMPQWPNQINSPIRPEENVRGLHPDDRLAERLAFVDTDRKFDLNNNFLLTYADGEPVRLHTDSRREPVIVDL